MKQRFSAFFGFFSRAELVLLFGSLALVIIPFFIFDKTEYLRLAASVIGVLALIFCAKGLPVGQIFMIAFCALYTVISYSFAYYGEMITYFCMSLPMAVFSLVSWLKNPYEAGHSEVKVGSLGNKERMLLAALSVFVTVAFYFILGYFNTANLVVSTLSVTTSFVAAYLTMRRSPFYAFAYMLNDVVLIVLWILASISDISYLSVTFCFVAFIANDLYGFIHWLTMRKRQAEGRKISSQA